MLTRTTRLIVSSFVIGLIAGGAAYRIATPYVSMARASLAAKKPVAVPDVELYRDVASIYRAFPATADVVMVGDSITWMADWGSIFPGVNILNRGIGYDNTVGLLSRLDTVNEVNAKAAFVMIGTNDFLETTDVDAVASRYAKILDRIEAPRIVVQSTLLTGAQVADRIPLISALNAKIEKLCSGRPRCQFVDLNAVLAPGGVLKPEFTIDGVHLNGPAYRIWADEIRPLITASAPVSG